MFVTGEVPTIDEILEAMDGYELVLPAARAHHYSNLAYGLLGEVVARLLGRPVHRLRRRAGSWRRSGSAGRPGRSRSLARSRYLVDEYAGTAGTRAAHRHGRGRRDGPALVDGRRPVPLGRLPGRGRRRRARRGDGRRDVGAAVDDEPRRVDGRLGARPRARRERGADLRRPRRRDARIPRRPLREPRDEDGRRGADELRHAGPDARHRPRPRPARRSSCGRPRSSPGGPSPPPPPRSPRSSATGGRRATSSCSRGRAAGSTARMPGAPRRIKPTVFEPLAEGGFRVGRGAGARRAAARSRATAWSGAATCSPARQEPTPS